MITGASLQRLFRVKIKRSHYATFALSTTGFWSAANSGSPQHRTCETFNTFQELCYIPQIVLGYKLSLKLISMNLLVVRCFLNIKKNGSNFDLICCSCSDSIICYTAQKLQTAALHAAFNVQYALLSSTSLHPWFYSFILIQITLYTNSCINKHRKAIIKR